MASRSQLVKTVKVPLCSGLKWERERISGTCWAITSQVSTETPSLRKSRLRPGGRPSPSALRAWGLHAAQAELSARACWCADSSVFDPGN